jgi:hypothetical protein
MPSNVPNEYMPCSHIQQTYQKSFTEITFAGLANAVNLTAWWIEGQIGRSNDFETIAFLGGVAEIRYAVYFLAAIKCGYKVIRH